MDLGGTPLPPLYGFFPKKFSSKRAKDCVFCSKKHLLLVQKIGFGGYPLPPFTDKIFNEKGVTDLGGTPPPLRTKSAK